MSKSETEEVKVPTISQTKDKLLKREIQNFIEHHCPAKAKSNIVKMLMIYLQSLQDYPEFHKDLLNDLDGIFDLLDAISSSLS